MRASRSGPPGNDPRRGHIVLSAQGQPCARRQPGGAHDGSARHPRGGFRGIVVVGRNLADKLVQYEAKSVGGINNPNYAVGQDAFKGQLAASYKRVGTTFTFKLKQGVK